MSEIVRTVKIVPVHQSIEGFWDWEKAGNEVKFGAGVFESNIPVDFYVQKQQGKVKCPSVLPGWYSSGFGMLGVADVNESKVSKADQDLGLVDELTLKQVLVFCKSWESGHVGHPDGLIELTEKQWEKERPRRDRHRAPLESGLLTIDKDGRIDPLCDAPFPNLEERGLIVVSSFKKEQGKLVFERPLVDFEESIETLREKERQRIEAMHERVRKLMATEPSPTGKSKRRKK